MNTAVAGVHVRLSDGFRLLWTRAGAFAPVFLCSGLLGIVYYAGFVWYATHLIRAFGFSPTKAGLVLGILYLCSSTLGTVLGVALSERLQRRGHTDAPIVAVAFFSVVALVTSAYSMVESLEISLAMLFLQSIALGSFFGNLVAALQLITPPSLRGINSAIFILWNNIISLSAGTTVIGALSTHLFARDAMGLGYSISITCAVCSAASIAAAIAGRRKYREAVARFA